MEWVTIHNPDLPDAPSARVTRQAFDSVWQGLGFELVGTQELEPEPEPEPEED